MCCWLFMLISFPSLDRLELHLHGYSEATWEWLLLCETYSIQIDGLEELDLSARSIQEAISVYRLFQLPKLQSLILNDEIHDGTLTIPPTKAPEELFLSDCLPETVLLL